MPDPFDLQGMPFDRRPAVPIAADAEDLARGEQRERILDAIDRECRRIEGELAHINFDHRERAEWFANAFARYVAELMSQEVKPESLTELAAMCVLVKEALETRDTLARR